MVTIGTLHLYPTSPSVNRTLDDEIHAVTPYDYGDYFESMDPSAFSPCDYGDHASSILPILYTLFFMVGFLGNMLVVWVLLMGVKMRSMTDVCLLNLALADLLLVSSLPFLAHYGTHQWIFGGFMCTIVLSAYHIGFYSGIFFIVLMSVDRYLAVVHAVFALRVRTRTYGILASVVIWIFAVLSSFPELMYLKISYYNKTETLCTAYPTDDTNSNHSSKTFGIFKMNILGLIIPLIVIGFCYSTILNRLLTNSSSRKPAIRLVILVTVVFFSCYTPYNVAAFVKALELKNLIGHSCENSKRITLSLQFTEAVAYLHSCLNPILYVFVFEKFRRHLFSLLYKTPCSRLHFMKSYFTQATGSVYSQTTRVEEQATTAV
ncbi:C-C chemokine receptor type 5-like [Xyrauchen texanus]|uniref:C-C chemokine receptor type 5-like n=1 Tax=Xyrauchen texanus TaxID=154827 RepID=UPI002241A5CC|nr:C-C chemokine receptor type 5-like [Xyrauchen texanus]XP_052000693.1 C-C chemokine receptor type 5-like [Xyrauchen texanus]